MREGVVAPRLGAELHLHRPCLSQQGTHLSGVPEHDASGTPDTAPEAVPGGDQPHVVPPRGHPPAERTGGVPAFVGQFEAGDAEVPERHGGAVGREGAGGGGEDRTGLLRVAQDHPIPGSLCVIQSTVSMRLPELYRLLTDSESGQDQQEILKQITRYSELLEYKDSKPC